MDPSHLKKLLEEVREGVTPVDSALDRLRHMPFEDLGFARSTTIARYAKA